MYQVHLEPRARKELENLQKRDRDRVMAVLADLAQNPLSGKKLEGDLEGYRSARAWPYRIVYLVRKKELFIIVIRIAHRQGVY